MVQKDDLSLRGFNVRETMTDFEQRNVEVFGTTDGVGDTIAWKMIVCPFHIKCSCYVSASSRMAHFYEVKDQKDE